MLAHRLNLHQPRKFHWPVRQPFFVQTQYGGPDIRPGLLWRCPTSAATNSREATDKQPELITRAFAMEIFLVMCKLVATAVVTEFAV
ncbi:hypothetical protein E6O75_ATG11633 [Venturia nashicola]|uniref:Uncharacterized protein n=1 Tax=Venturia nashicola TaxID=86259 RepID=A0A4Z1P6A9_9PEZI|nr:hypothetical protein E6O75_ATG11633 [Venturia nashicola]